MKRKGEARHPAAQQRVRVGNSRLTRLADRHVREGAQLTPATEPGVHVGTITATDEVDVTFVPRHQFCAANAAILAEFPSAGDLLGALDFSKHSLWFYTARDPDTGDYTTVLRRVALLPPEHKPCVRTVWVRLVPAADFGWSVLRKSSSVFAMVMVPLAFCEARAQWMRCRAAPVWRSGVFHWLLDSSATPDTQLEVPAFPPQRPDAEEADVPVVALAVFPKLQSVFAEDAPEIGAEDGDWRHVADVSRIGIARDGRACRLLVMNPFEGGGAAVRPDQLCTDPTGSTLADCQRAPSDATSRRALLSVNVTRRLPFRVGRSWALYAPYDVPMALIRIPDLEGADESTWWPSERDRSSIQGLVAFHMGATTPIAFGTTLLVMSYLGM